MGLALVLLPLGISPWNTGSGTSCSHCHENMRRKWSALLSPASQEVGVTAGKLLRTGNTSVGNWMLQKSTRGSMRAVCRLLCALLVWHKSFVTFPLSWITKTEHRLWHFLHDVTSSPPVDLFGSPSLLCCHRNPRRGTRAQKMKTGPRSRRQHRTCISALLPLALSNAFRSHDNEILLKQLRTIWTHTYKARLNHDRGREEDDLKWQYQIWFRGFWSSAGFGWRYKGNEEARLFSLYK